MIHTQAPTSDPDRAYFTRRTAGLFFLLVALGVGVLSDAGCNDGGRFTSTTPPTTTPSLIDAGLPAFTADDTPETIKAKTETAIAIIEAKGEVKAAARKGEAEDDFYDTAKAVTGWILAGLALTALACFIGSLIPWGRAVGLDAGDATKALAGVAVVSVARFALLRWGIMAANVGFWVVIVLAIVAAVMTLWPIVAGAVRRVKDRPVASAYSGGRR